MKVPVKAMKIICDVCGQTYENYNGWTCIVGDDDGSDIRNDAIDNGWLCIGDKDYCPKCHYLNDEDHFVCKDGRVYDFETEDEICNETMKSS